MGNVARLFVILIVVVASCLGPDDGPAASVAVWLCAGQRSPRGKHKARPRMRRIRVLLYARGTPDEIKDQHDECQRKADVLGDEIVSLASDPPDGCVGWASARAMLAAGEVDLIRVTSREVIPLAPYVESATHEMRSPLHGRDPERGEPPWRRRPQRLRDVKRHR